MAKRHDSNIEHLTSESNQARCRDEITGLRWIASTEASPLAAARSSGYRYSSRLRLTSCYAPQPAVSPPLLAQGESGGETNAYTTAYYTLDFFSILRPMADAKRYSAIDLCALPRRDSVAQGSADHGNMANRHAVSTPLSSAFCTLRLQATDIRIPRSWRYTRLLVTSAIEDRSSRHR